MRNPHYGDDYYSQMWTRFPAYLVGILLGYLLHQTRNKKVVLNKVRTTILIIKLIIGQQLRFDIYILVCCGRWLGLGNGCRIGHSLRTGSLLE